MTTTYYKGYTITSEDISSHFLISGNGNQFMTGTMNDAIEAIDKITDERNSAPVLRCRLDIRNEKSKIAQEVYTYLDCEVFYISPECIDVEKMQVYVLRGSSWMFCRKPPKKVIDWFTRYIERKYGYTVVDFI